MDTILASRNELSLCMIHRSVQIRYGRQSVSRGGMHNARPIGILLYVCPDKSEPAERSRKHKPWRHDGSSSGAPRSSSSSPSPGGRSGPGREGGGGKRQARSAAERARLRPFFSSPSFASADHPRRSVLPSPLRWRSPREQNGRDPTVKKPEP